MQTATPHVYIRPHVTQKPRIYNVSYMMHAQDNGHCASFVNKHNAEQFAKDLRIDGAYTVQEWTA